MKTTESVTVRGARALAEVLIGVSFWGAAVMPVRAVSPSISPWETILSSDTPAGTENDRFPEVIVSGQTVHMVCVSSIGYDRNFLCYRRSTDGGITWQDRIILGDYSGDTNSTLQNGETTRLAVDGGNVHVIQSQIVPGWHYEIDYFRSTDGGATFENKRAIAISDKYWHFQIPRIVAGGGKVTVAYSYSPNWYSNSSGHLLLSNDNGGTFGQTMVLDNSNSVYGYAYDCMDVKRTADKIVSIWKVSSNNKFIIVSSNDGGATIHTADMPLVSEAWSTNTDYMRPQLCAITGNTMHVAWNQRNENGRSALFYARSLDGGMTFHAARDMSEGTIGAEEVRPQKVIMTALGTHVYLCYVSNSSGGVWLRASSDAGATFGAAVPLHLPESTVAGGGSTQRQFGDGDSPEMQLDPADPTGAHATFAFVRGVIAQTTDGGATITPRLLFAHPWMYGNGWPHSFRLLPVASPTGTIWSVLYAGSRKWYDSGQFLNYDSDLFYRRFTPEPEPTPGNKVLHLGGLPPASPRQDMLQIPSGPALQFSSTLTAAMWVRITPGTIRDNTGMELLQWGAGNNGLAFRAWVSGGAALNHTVYGKLRTTSGIYLFGDCPIDRDGGWHHLALTYDANGGPFNLRFYVDGRLFQSVTATGTFVPIPEPIMVGASTSGSGLFPLNGDVDNLRFWNRALSEAEVRALAFSADLTGSEAGLAAAFSFDDTVKDLSGNGADGLLQFGAQYATASGVPTSPLTEWADDFSSNSLRAEHWTTSPSTTLYSIDTSHGDLRVGKPVGGSGAMSEWMRITSLLMATGNFDVSVDFRDAVLTRSRDWGNHLVLNCVIDGQNFGIVRSDEGDGHGNDLRTSTDTNGWLGLRSNSDTAGTFRILRRGSQISTYYNGELTASTPCPTGPAGFELMWNNNGTPDALSATIDNFTLAGTSLLPRTATNEVTHISNMDLWNFDKGTVIDGSSGTIDRYFPLNAFGSVYSNSSEPYATIFRDGAPNATVHWVAWHMPDAQIIRSVALWAADDTPSSRNRATSHFKLFGKAQSGDAWTPLVDQDLPYVYSPARAAVIANIANPIIARYYRAEFTQISGTDNYGPRVLEIDGFGDSVNRPPQGTYAGWAFDHQIDLSGGGPNGDADHDGAPNLMEYAAGTLPELAGSVPPAPVLGTEGETPSGPFFTVTTRLAKPVPADLDITGEFTMDLGMVPWMFTGISGTDTDQGDHIDRTFKAPLMIGFPPTGFMRVKVGQR